MMRALLLSALAAAGAVSPAAAQFESVRVQVVDVGQADGILIRTPNSHWVLIDAGQDDVLAEALPTTFGVDEIELAFASHRHRDHIGGLDDVIGAVSIGAFVGELGDYASGRDDDRMRDSLDEKSVDVLGAEPDTFEIDGVTFIVLPRPPLNTNENNNSIVVRMEYGDFSMLFAGDAEEALLDWLVSNHPGLLDADVLKASHHGSHNGTSVEWLEAVTPDHVVISAGLHRGFKHPHEEAVDAYLEATGDRVFCTNRHGTIRVYGYSDGSVRITRQRSTNKDCTYDGTHY